MLQKAKLGVVLRIPVDICVTNGDESLRDDACITDNIVFNRPSRAYQLWVSFFGVPAHAPHLSLLKNRIRGRAREIDRER